MTSKGRKRTSKNYPSHIEPEKLPKGVEYIDRGEGFFRIAYTDNLNGKRKYRRLCGSKTSLSQIWQAVEAQKESTALTFEFLSIAYQNSSKWREISTLTQKDYLTCHRQICNTKTGKCLFGDLKFSSWTTGTIRKYVDFRGEASRARANKELSYIKTVLKWAKEYDKIPINISEGVSKLKISPRQHYATESDFNFLLDVARESGYYYMAPLLELCYQCRMRLSEALDLTDSAEIPNEGLKIKRRKGSRTNIILWSTSLKKTWDDLKAKRKKILESKQIPPQIDPNRRFIFISERTGERLSISGVETAKKRIDLMAKDKADRLGIEYVHFTIHDVKRSATTDTPGTASDKMLATGHRSLSMMNVYDVSIAKVKATKDD